MRRSEAMACKIQPAPKCVALHVDVANVAARQYTQTPGISVGWSEGGWRMGEDKGEDRGPWRLPFGLPKKQKTGVLMVKWTPGAGRGRLVTLRFFLFNLGVVPALDPNDESVSCRSPSPALSPLMSLTNVSNCAKFQNIGESHGRAWNDCIPPPPSPDRPMLSEPSACKPAVAAVQGVLRRNLNPVPVRGSYDLAQTLGPASHLRRVFAVVISAHVGGAPPRRRHWLAAVVAGHADAALDDDPGDDP